MSIDQWIILLTGPTAVLMSQGRWPTLRRYACFVGLFSQIGWFWAATKDAQLGVFMASFVYTGCWCVGLYNYWLRPKPEASYGPR